MNNHFISIGFQCTVARVFENLNIKEETLPFDWMLAPPHFVKDIYELLFVQRMDIQELVREVFFTKDTLAEFHYPEYHTGDSRMGWIPRTQKYNAIFPHDLIETPETFEEIVQKYVRRFERLQSLILDNTNNLNFVYISQSSLERGNFVVDNVPVIVDVYNNLNKLYDIIKSIRSDNFKFIMIDSINSEDSVHLNKNIIRHIIQPKSEWLHIVDDCMEVLKVYV